MTAPSRMINGHGYAYYQVRVNGERKTVQEHQLVALLDGADPVKVFSNGRYQVHHKDAVIGDSELACLLRQFNYSANLELLKDGEHSQKTQSQRGEA